MRLEKLKVPLYALTRDNKHMLSKVEPLFNWKDKKVTEERIGTQFTILLKEFDYEQVKVRTDEIMVQVSNDDIENSLEPIYISFVNPVLGFYKNYQTKEYSVSIKADKVDKVIIADTIEI